MKNVNLYKIFARYPREGLALAALLTGAIAIAFAPIFVRLSELGPSATAFYRLAFALPLLGPWMWIESQRTLETCRSPRPKDYWQLAIAGLFFAADLAVWHWSIQFTSVANATLLANFAPVFVALGGWLFFGDRFTTIFLLGMVTAFLGITLLMGDSLSLSLLHLFGDALGMLTAVFYAGYILAVSRLRLRFSTAMIMTWSGLITCIALLVVALLSGESLVAQTAYGWSVLVALALISQVIGQSLIAYALAYLPAAFSSLSLLLQPVAATILAWMIFDEALSPWQGVGGAIMLAGIVLARHGGRRG